MRPLNLPQINPDDNSSQQDSSVRPSVSQSDASQARVAQEQTSTVVAEAYQDSEQRDAKRAEAKTRKEVTSSSATRKLDADEYAEQTAKSEADEYAERAQKSTEQAPGEQKAAAQQPAEQQPESRFNKADVFKFLGLLAFIALMALICWLAWPMISDVFNEGGVDRLVENVTSAGPVGVLMLLGLQFLQIVVAFIPGEVVQVAAGMMYGPWLGALIIVVGCVISSAFIYWLVHKLGAPFVQAMVPKKFMERLDGFEKTGKLKITVFVLFLIPGLPKDTFTYLVPLTNMGMRDFLILSNVARIPGILLSTFAANHLIEGNIWQSVLLFGIAAILALLGLFAGKKYLDYKFQKEDPEGFEVEQLKRAEKKAKRKAKREVRKAKKEDKRAAKRAAGFEEYQQVQERIARRHAEEQLAQRIAQNDAQASADNK